MLYYANTDDHKTDKFFDDDKEVEAVDDPNVEGSKEYRNSDGILILGEDDGCLGGACSI